MNTWNPLRCGSTALPANLLLLAKIIAAAYLLSDVRMLPSPFLPFLSPLDQFTGSEPFAWILRAALFTSGLALLTNRVPRLAAFAMGLTVMTAVVGSKAYYGNNKLFAASMLLLTGLWHPRIGPWLLRAQMVIVYFGAGLNKALDPDWHSGQFFHHWAGARLQQPLYLWAADWFPPLVLGKFVCWSVIVTELGLAAAFLIPRTWPIAIWVSLLFHAGLLEFTGTTFNMFFYSMQAAMLAFVTWPREKLVIYDGDCGICNQIRSGLERIDFEQPPAFTWRTLQSGAGNAFGISGAALEQRLHAVFDGRVYAGFRACKMILLYNPAFFLAVTVLLAAPPSNWIWYRRILVAALLAFFFPAFNFIGERVYDWVAANRYRFSTGGACAVDPAQQPRSS